jgi:hypothetical protein
MELAAKDKPQRRRSAFEKKNAWMMSQSDWDLLSSNNRNKNNSNSKRNQQSTTVAGESTKQPTETVVAAAMVAEQQPSCSSSTQEQEQPLPHPILPTPRRSVLSYGPRMPAIHAVRPSHTNAKKAAIPPPPSNGLDRTFVQTLQQIRMAPVDSSTTSTTLFESEGRDSESRQPSTGQDRATPFENHPRHAPVSSHNSQQPAKRSKTSWQRVEVPVEPLVQINVEPHGCWSGAASTTTSQNNGRKTISEGVVAVVDPQPSRPSSTTTTRRTIHKLHDHSKGVSSTAATSTTSTTTTSTTTSINNENQWPRNTMHAMMNHPGQPQFQGGLDAAPQSPVRQRPGYWNENSHGNVNGSPLPSPNSSSTSRRPRSRAIAIKRRSNHPYYYGTTTLDGTSSTDEFPSSQSEHSSERMYDWATWRMYNRIVDHRRNQQQRPLLKVSAMNGLVGHVESSLLPLGGGGGGIGCYPPAFSVPHAYHPVASGGGGGMLYEPTGMGACDYIHDGEVFELDDI